MIAKKEPSSAWLLAQHYARGLMMTGPKATPPTGRAVRKMARRMMRLGAAHGIGKRPWRAYPAEVLSYAE